MTTRRAVSLVEFLLVVGICAVLVGLSLPAVQKARERALAMTCRNNLHQINLAVGNYVEGHYHLGVALSRLGRPRDAEAALRRCLSLRPNLLAAYGRLIELYEADGPLADSARVRQLRQQANEIILQRRLRRRLEKPAPPQQSGPAASGPKSAAAARPPAG